MTVFWSVILWISKMFEWGNLWPLHSKFSEFVSSLATTYLYQKRRILSGPVILGTILAHCYHLMIMTSETMHNDRQCPSYLCHMEINEHFFSVPECVSISFWWNANPLCSYQFKQISIHPGLFPVRLRWAFILDSVRGFHKLKFNFQDSYEWTLEGYSQRILLIHHLYKPDQVELGV